jgi:hypothetical protein
MSESQHSTIDFGMSVNSVGRGIALAVGKEACVGGGVVGGDHSSVELFVGALVASLVAVSFTL